jgi:TolA-binding protein
MSTKAELKQNVLASKLEELTPWLIAHRMHALMALGIVVGVSLIASVFIIRKNESRDINWTRLAQAQILIGQKRADGAAQILTEIKNANPGSVEALYASYYLGESALEEKKFDEAIQHFSTVVSQGGNQPIRPLALTNLGFANEQKGDYQAAAQTYQQFMSQYAEHFLAARVQLSLGEALFRAGDKEGAKKSLGQLVDLYPTSPWAQNARKIMDKLETR